MSHTSSESDHIPIEDEEAEPPQVGEKNSEGFHENNLYLHEASVSSGKGTCNEAFDSESKDVDRTGSEMKPQTRKKLLV